MFKIVFAGGGTGGHIYPGLAVADELRILFSNKNVSDALKLYWIGNSAGMDKSIVEKSQNPSGKCSVDKFFGIPSGKLRRYFTISNFIDVFKIFGGCVASFFILLKIKPDVLFSKGGFVSVPPCLCAKILGIPVYTHECDFTPGLATRINSKSASKILLSYEETKKFFSSSIQKKLIVTGNPIRPIFYSADKNRGFDFLGIDKNSIEKPILLVLGGSSGSVQINSLVLENLEWLCERFIVVHQTGVKNDSALVNNENSTLSENIKANYKPYPFIYNQMPDVIACADVILSRAGANSLWECAVAKKPMVLVPLCGTATRGDQVDNAEFFANHGIAEILLGKNADEEHLKSSLTKMLDKQVRENYANSCNKILPEKRPATIIAELLNSGV